MKLKDLLFFVVDILCMQHCTKHCFIHLLELFYVQCLQLGVKKLQHYDGTGDETLFNASY